MAIRTTSEAVQLVLAPGKDYRPGAELAPFIRVGNNLTNWVAANAASYHKPVPDAATLLEIETWLAAWAYKESDQQFQSDGAGRSSATRKGTSGLGLDNNNYGQAAKVMDTSGLLRALDGGKIASARWVGKTLSEMINYADRN